MRHLSIAPLVLVLALAGSGCNEAPRAPGEGVALPNGASFSRAALLGAIGSCVAAEAKDFAAASAQLAARVGEAVVDESKRAAAQAAWHDTMHVWQLLETMQIGPQAMRSLPGGQELRQAIYAWPAVNRCAIEQALVDKRYQLPAILAGSIEVRGLLATEYLLFYAGTDNVCAPNDPINGTGTWAALSATELASRKLAYAKVLVDDIAKQGQTLAAAWDPAQGNFVAQLATAGAGSTIYRNAQFALNSVTDALFYIDADLKDMKVARPAGLGSCTNATCPEALKSQWAGASKAHARDNLVGFRKIFTGCVPEQASALGFDDFLYAVGATELGGQIDAAAVAAIAAVDAITEPDMRSALDQDLDLVRGLYNQIRGVTDLMKTQFISVLDLEIPRRIEGDND